jgi:general secretion pathway protein D
MNNLTITIAGCLLLGTSPGFAQEPDATQSPPPAPLPKGQWTDLRTLVREVTAKSHKRFVLDPRVPQYVDTADFELKDINYPELLAILQVHGFAVVAEDGVWVVVPDINAGRELTPVVGPDNIKALDDEWVTCLVTLKNSSASQLVAVIRPLMPPNAFLGAITDRNALLLSDRAGNVRRIVQLIGMIDKLPRTVIEAAPAKAP